MDNFKSAFDWDIEKRQILDINGNPITGYNEIYRKGFDNQDNDGTIAVMKKSYNPVTTSQFTQTIEEIAHKIGADIAGYEDWSLGHSQRQVITAQIQLSNELSIAGSKIQGFLTIGTGFDGNRSFYVGHTNQYLRCTNQWGSIITEMTARLTKNVLLRVQDIMDSIELYTEYEKKIYKSFEEFQKVKIDEGIIEECIARLVNLTEEERKMNPKELEEAISSQKMNKMDEIRASLLTECAELGHNAWGLFNGVTYYTTHVMNTRTEEQFGNLFGAKNTANQKAFDLCTELL